MVTMDEILHSMTRTLISVLILMLVSLWAGKQINSHINHYNFALSVIIGSFISNMGFDTNLKFIPMLAALCTLILVYFCLSLISSRNRNFRIWVSGRPTVVIQEGKILDRNMKKTRYTLDDLNQQLREQGVFNIDEVDYALLEISGKLSIQKKTEYQNITKGDLLPNLENVKINQPVELIMDGQIIDKNLRGNYSQGWLNQELKNRQLALEEIQYAVISSNGNLFIDFYNDQIKSPIDKE